MTIAGDQTLSRGDSSIGSIGMAVDPDKFSALNLMREDRLSRLAAGPTDASSSGTNGDILKKMGLPEDSMLLCRGDGPDLQDKVAQANDVAGKVNLATGGKYANNPFYNPSMGALGVATGVDVTPDFIAGVVKSSFDRLGDLNRALAGNTKKAGGYVPVTKDGKPAAIGAQDGWLGCPKLEINVEGEVRSIKMNLPGFPDGSKNVALVTDSRHLLAIDPKTKRVWALDADKDALGYHFKWNEVTKK